VFQLALPYCIVNRRLFTADLVTLLHAYGYLMAATNSLGAEQTLCRAFHSVVCFNRAETLAYANFSFAGETLYRLYRLSLPRSDDDDERRAHHHAQLFPALASCRREIFDDLDQYGMAIDPSLCDYGRKNETAIREVDRLTVLDASRLAKRIDNTTHDHEQACRSRLRMAVAVVGVTVIYVVVTHVIRCVWIMVERRWRTKSTTASSRRKLRRLESNRESPTTGDDVGLPAEYAPHRYDGWAGCNGDGPTTAVKTETTAASDERTLASVRCDPEDDAGGRQSKILSVTSSFQHAQISV